MSEPKPAISSARLIRMAQKIQDQLKALADSRLTQPDKVLNKSNGGFQEKLNELKSELVKLLTKVGSHGESDRSSLTKGSMSDVKRVVWQMVSSC